MTTGRFATSLITVIAVCGLVILAASIYRSAETPPWQANKKSHPPVPEKSELVTKAAVDFEPFNFATYNVKNWLTSSQTSEKTVESKAAVISMILAAEADIVGLSEIGSKADVAEIQAHLKERGFDFPYSYYTGGVDRIRHLAIISRFPIVFTQKIDPKITGTDYFLQRGILDATIKIGGQEIRFIGLHLKSKRIDTNFDQAVLRLEEAKFVRKHIDTVLEKNPETLLVAYGDWNDSLRSLSTRAILGVYRTHSYLSAIHAGDSRGEKWTYNWARDYSYSRIDFVAVSQKLKSHVNKEKSRVVDEPFWHEASDHRPVMIRFEP